jgi:hypothetical protein
VAGRTEVGENVSQLRSRDETIAVAVEHLLSRSKIDNIIGSS